MHKYAVPCRDEVAPRPWTGKMTHMNETAEMKPMAQPNVTAASLRPIRMWRHFHAERLLIQQFAWRDAMQRYKGSYLGILWSLIVPLMMLTVYAFIFSEVFKSRGFGTIAHESKVDFGLTLFCGLIVFNVFGETVQRAPGLIVGNPNYVKKVVFSVETLPVSALGTSLINAAMSVAVLLVGWAIFHHSVSSTIWLFPLVLLPLCLLSLGLCWMLAALGVFLRDLSYPVTVVLQVMFFMSGIFFPLSTVPASYRGLMRLNPLLSILEDSRRTLLWGMAPDWKWWVPVTLASLLVFELGYYAFMRSKKAFADVV